MFRKDFVERGKCYGIAAGRIEQADLDYCTASTLRPEENGAISQLSPSSSSPAARRETPSTRLFALPSGNPVPSIGGSWQNRRLRREPLPVPSRSAAGKSRAASRCAAKPRWRRDKRVPPPGAQVEYRSNGLPSRPQDTRRGKFLNQDFVPFLVSMPLGRRRAQPSLAFRCPPCRLKNWTQSYGGLSRVQGDRCGLRSWHDLRCRRTMPLCGSAVVERRSCAISPSSAVARCSQCAWDWPIMGSDNASLRKGVSEEHRCCA